MSTNRLKNQFQWEEEIPEIGQKGDLFRDRIFVVSGKRGKIIKFSASFAYDVPEIRFEMKIVEGKKLLNQVIDLQFRFTLGGTTGSLPVLGSWQKADNKLSIIKLYKDIHYTRIYFDSIFCDGNHGKKVTFSLTTTFDVLKMDEEPIMEKCLKLPEMLYMEEELSDIKLICGREIFECHKLVLSCQSDVFKTMFKTKSTAEEESGEVQILNFEARTVGNMVYFMYHDKIKDEENMDPELLILADKYNVRGLMNYCVEYFEENLSLENALDVLVSAELTGQKSLYDAATQFAIENRRRLTKTESWKELLETNPKLANTIAMTMLQLE